MLNTNTVWIDPNSFLMTFNLAWVTYNLTCIYNVSAWMTYNLNWIFNVSVWIDFASVFLKNCNCFPSISKMVRHTSRFSVAMPARARPW